MPGGDRQGWRRGAGLTAGTGRHRPAARLGPRPKCFLVPVINLWWPYQSTRDLLPAGHPDRPLVLRWFLLWVVGGAVSFMVVVASMFVDSGAGWALVAVPAALTTLAGLAARQVVANALAAHQVLASRRY